MDKGTMKVYHYNGPVYRYGKCMEGFQGETQAVTPEKALANLMHQYKIKFGMEPWAPIKFDKKYLKEETL